MKPISIVGGGLAGLSLALRLQQSGVPVTVYEKRNYPQHRVCGEFISGVSEQTLARMQILDLMGDSRQISQVEWFIQNQSIFEYQLEKPARGISRYYLDHLLATRLQQRGGEVIRKNGPEASWRRNRMGMSLMNREVDWLACI